MATMMCEVLITDLAQNQAGFDLRQRAVELATRALTREGIDAGTISVSERREWFPPIEEQGDDRTPQMATRISVQGERPEEAY